MLAAFLSFDFDNGMSNISKLKNIFTYFGCMFSTEASKKFQALFYEIKCCFDVDFNLHATGDNRFTLCLFTLLSIDHEKPSSGFSNITAYRLARVGEKE